MVDAVYPKSSQALAQQRRDLAPAIEGSFRQFSRHVFADGALSARVKELIAVAVAHVTQCPYCIRGHTRGAQRQGATGEQIMEAIWVAAEMRAGAAFAHSVLALDALEQPGVEQLTAEGRDDVGRQSPDH